MKADFDLNECNIIAHGLRLTRESLLRARKKEIPGSDMFSLYNRQLESITAVEVKVFALVDGVAK